MRHILLAGTALLLAACGRVESLQVDFLTAPQAVGGSETIFSWAHPDEADFRQERCRVVIRGVWDSGEIESSSSRVILPQDVLLKSLRKYRWKVEIRDADGRRRTGRASFRTGIFPSGNWTGQWIAPASETAAQPLFRTSFRVGSRLSRALLCLGATGSVLAWVNGKAVVVPDGTSGSLYRNIAGHYRIYDLTDRLSKGTNTFVAQVVASASPCLMAEIHLFYKDGSHDIVGTDGSWEISRDGPYTLLKDGIQFDSIAPDSLSWQAAALSAAGYRVLLPDSSPVSVPERVVPDSYRQGDTLRVFDFGNEIYAGCNVEASGKEGDIVELRYLDAAGKRIAADRIILGRRGKARWEDCFVRRNFRQIEALGPEGTRVRVEAVVYPPSPASWSDLRGKVEGFLLDPSPEKAPLGAVDTLYSMYGDREILDKAWPMLASYVAGARHKSLEENILMEKFALSTGRDATPYSETRRIMTGK